MNPWTALLESLHSALIDEVNERLPKVKPELGLPLRQARFQVPGDDVDQVFQVQVFFGEQTGAAFLASTKPALDSLKLDLSGLWKAMMQRAGSEFNRRQIQPKLGASETWKWPGKVADNVGGLGRIIWIPLKIPKGSCYFGIGV